MSSLTSLHNCEHILYVSTTYSASEVEATAIVLIARLFMQCWLLPGIWHWTQRHVVIFSPAPWKVPPTGSVRAQGL